MFDDKANLSFKAYVKVVNNKRTKYSFYIYTYGYIFNDTIHPLVFYYSNEARGQLIAGQIADYDVLMISKRLSIRVGLTPMNLSPPLFISK